jgi:hypothetical protein
MVLVRIFLYVSVKCLLVGALNVTLKLDFFGKGIFTRQRARYMKCALVAFLFALLGFSISFASIPLFSSSSAEEQVIMGTFRAPKCSSQQGKTSTNLQSKRSLSSAASQSPLFIQTINVARPRAILSLSGTLGGNGWYVSDVEGSLYVTGDDSESLTAEYAFYNQGWTTYSEPFIIFEEGQTAIYYRVRNATGFVWETTVSKVDIDKTPPYGSVLIAGGAKEAFSTVVNLTLSVTDAPSGPTTPPPPGYIWGVPSGPADMRFSNNGILWSNWEPIANHKSWTLETGAGNKTVYVQARDNADLVSEKFSDTINLITTGDSLAPMTSITLSGSQNSLGVYTSDVILILSAIDDLSGINLTEYSFDAKNWTVYTAPFAISAEGQTTIYYRTHDLAGNVESTNSQTVNIERTEKSDSTILTLVVYGAVAAVVISIIVAIVLRRRKKRQFK